MTNTDEKKKLIDSIAQRADKCHHCIDHEPRRCKDCDTELKWNSTFCPKCGLWNPRRVI